MMPPIRNTKRQAIGCKEKSRRFYLRIYQLAEIYIFEKLFLFVTRHLYSKQPAVCWFYSNLSVYLCMRMNIRSNIRSICELIRSVDVGACLCLLACLLAIDIQWFIFRNEEKDVYLLLLRYVRIVLLIL